MAKRRRVWFTKHALRDAMPKRGISVSDVFRTLDAPDYEFPGNQPNTVESYGRTADGRAFYVVTGRSRSLVITAIPLKEEPK